MNMLLVITLVALSLHVCMGQPRQGQGQGPPSQDPNFPFSIVAPLPGDQPNPNSYNSEYDDQPQGGNGYEPGYGNQFGSPNTYNNPQRLSLLQNMNMNSIMSTTGISQATASQPLSAGFGILMLLLILLIILGCILCYMFPQSQFAKKLEDKLRRPNGYSNLARYEDVEDAQPKDSNHHRGCKRENISIKLRPVSECPIEGITVEEISCSECTENEGKNNGGSRIKKERRSGTRKGMKRSKPVKLQRYDPSESEYVVYQKSPRGKLTYDLTKSQKLNLAQNRSSEVDETIAAHKMKKYQHFNEEKNRMPVRNRDNDSSGSSSPRNIQQQGRPDDVNHSSAFLEEHMVKW